MTIDFHPSNIIVKMPNWLGDLVMATPILEDIKQRFPGARLTAMCLSHLAPMLERDPHVADIYAYERPSGWIHRCQHREIIQNIRRGEYDLGVLLSNSFSSAWWLWRGGVKRRIGYRGNLRSLLLTEAIPKPKERGKQHLVVTYKELLTPLGVGISTTKPRLYISEQELQQAKDTLMKIVPLDFDQSIIIGINPGAAYGSAKCWYPERFAAVSQKLLSNPRVCIVYFGDSSQLSLIEGICAQISSDRVINLAGKTSLRELAAYIKQCGVFLSNDSGPMHVAAALEVPLVALFGSTNEVATGPYQWGEVIHKHVECSPCYKRVCPIDFRCMDRIYVDEVYMALQKQMNKL
jgi:heptosyltransferase-2